MNEIRRNRVRVKMEKDMLVLSITTLITAVVWTSLAVYRALVKSDITNVTEEQLSPLNPKLKLNVIDELKEKNGFNLSSEGSSQPLNNNDILVEGQ